MTARPALDVVREALTTLAAGREGFVYELALEALLRVGEEARAIADAELDTLRGELHAALLTIERSRDARERAQADARAAWERFNDAERAHSLEVDAAAKLVEERDATIAKLVAALGEIQARHDGMVHDDDCAGGRHDNGDCACPPEAEESTPCVDGECDCCLSTDVIWGALAAATKVAA